MSESPLILSVSGLRGIVGGSLTHQVAARYGAAVGAWVREKTGEQSPHVVVGRDSRPSGEMIERAAVSGLCAAGCRVTTLGIATTPGTAIMIDHLKADGGLVVTASHNPSQWNGIKTLRGDGLAPSKGEAEGIIARFHQTMDVPGGEAGATRDDSVVRVHVDRVLRCVDVEWIRRAGLGVVLDSNHGAGAPEARALLDALGVGARIIGEEPTGAFTHTPEPTRENLTGLCEAMRGSGAQVGFAQDPDADRLAIVDERGVYIGEEYTLALCAEHWLSKHGGPVVTNLSTSRMVDDIAAKYGARCERTAVGEAHVAGRMKELGASIGGEGNGGVILPGVTWVRDSLVGMALVLEMLAKSAPAFAGVTAPPLSWHVAQIPAYAIVKEKVEVREGMAARAIESLKARFSRERIDLQDGIRIDRDGERSWVHVRASNTEPILRIIAEAPTEEAARGWVRECNEAIMWTG